MKNIFYKTKNLIDFFYIKCYYKLYFTKERICMSADRRQGDRRHLDRRQGDRRQTDTKQEETYDYNASKKNTKVTLRSIIICSVIIFVVLISLIVIIIVNKNQLSEQNTYNNDTLEVNEPDLPYLDSNHSSDPSIENLHLITND